MSSEKADSWSALYADVYHEAERDLSEQGGDTGAPIDALLDQFADRTDRYEIGEAIGKGGAKKVYRAYDRHSQREVALAQPVSSDSPEILEIFLREARITASLDHPNIITLFGIGLSDDATPFFTMELKRGGALSRLLSSEAGITPKPAEALRIFASICNAIAYAHSHNIVHLDLKPQNIQVGDQGEVQVCDWGLGCAISNGESEESGVDRDLCGDNGDLSLGRGTPGYMAPEQKEEHRSAAPAADIYSLGKILADLTTSFPSNSARRLNTIVKKSCAQNPEDRYPTVGALLDDILRFRENLPTSVEPGGMLGATSLLLRRNQQRVTFAAIGLTLLALLAAISQSKISQIEQSRSAALASELKALQLAESAQSAAEEAQLAREVDAYDRSLILLDLFVLEPYYSRYAVEQSIAHLEDVVGSNSEDFAQGSAQLGYAYLIAQRFDDSVQAFGETGLEPDLLALATRFQDTPLEGDCIPVEQMIAFLQEIDPRRKNFIEKVLIYDQSVRQDWGEKVAVTLAALEILNEGWSSSACAWSEQEKSLLLQGEGLRTLSGSFEKTFEVKKCLLLGLDLKHLRFKGTGFRKFKELADLSVRTIDLSAEGDFRVDLIPPIRSLDRLFLPEHLRASWEVAAPEMPGLRISFR